MHVYLLDKVMVSAYFLRTFPPHSPRSLIEAGNCFISVDHQELIVVEQHCHCLPN